MKSIIKVALLGLAASVSTWALPVTPCGGGVNVLSLNPEGCTTGSLTFTNFVVQPTPGALVLMSGSSVNGAGTVFLTFSINPASKPGDVILGYKVTGLTTGIDFSLLGVPASDIEFTEFACSTELCA